MMKKVIFVATVLSCLMAGTANAGWIYYNGMLFYTGSIKIEVPLVGTGNVEDQELWIDATLHETQSVCVNPNNHDVWKPGVAGINTISVDAPITPDAEIDENGRVIVSAEITNDQLEENSSCVNHKWNFVDGSTAATLVSFEVTWVEFDYNPSSCKDEVLYETDEFGEPLLEFPLESPYCVVDYVKVACTFSPVERYAVDVTASDGITGTPGNQHQVVPGQTYECNQI